MTTQPTQITIGQIRRGSDDSIRIDQAKAGLWRCIYKSRSRMDAQDDSEWLSYAAIERNYPEVLGGREAELEEERFHGDDASPGDPVHIVRMGLPPIEFIDVALGSNAGIHVRHAENAPERFVIRCFGKGHETFDKRQLRSLAEALLELARAS